ncbi:hypothetical protein UMZ34_23330 [Halopseudomonas pachastrellae]|nr:hypothetical protein UMZ34_23330 [Halopseudomonas pachastrellae]
MTLRGDHSEPVSLRVLTAEQLANADPANQAPVFINAEVDTRNPYVQAQVLLTLRIFHSVSLYDDSTLSGLDIPDARVEALSAPKTYERTLDGVVHGVIEIRYAIYPQRSGPLEIPSQLFSATALQPREAGSNSGHNARFVQLRSPSLQLEVRPVPDSYPADTPWLPARQVRLSQNWQPDPNQELQRGEPLTRTLSIQADGLTASQLPELSALSGGDDDLRQYSDQPQLENQLSDSGILGLRQESSAVVTRHAGRFEIPAIRVQWWNTQTDQLETSELAAVQLNVRGNGNAPPPPPDWNLPPGADASPNWPWQLLSAALFCALLAALHLLRTARRELNACNNWTKTASALRPTSPTTRSPTCRPPAATTARPKPARRWNTGPSARTAT